MRSFAPSIFVLLLGLAACGDDKDPIITGTPLTTSTMTTNPTTTDNPTTSTGTATEAGTAMDGGSATGTGMATEAGSATDAGTGSSGAPGSSSGASTGGGGGGDGYGPCEMSNPPCPPGSQCLMIEGLEGNFCSPKCEGMMCPMPSDGTAQAFCALMMMGSMTPVNCALICDPMMMGQCPMGSTCKNVPMQPMPVGICTYP